MDAVRVLTLKNKGAFIVQLQVEWSAGAARGVYAPSGAFCAGAAHSVDLADAAEIPQGASVRLRAAVTGGHSLAATQRFTYSAKYGGSAVYAVKGTSLGATLAIEKQDTTRVECGAASLYQCLKDGVLAAFPALRQTKNTRFQFAAVPMAADWDQTAYAAFYGLADIVPGDTGDFYTVGSAHVSQAYADLLGCLAARFGEEDPAYQRLEDLHRTAAVQYRQCVDAAADAFLLAQRERRTAAADLSAWLRTPEGDGWQRTLDRQRSKMDSFQAEMSELLQRIRAPLQRAQEALVSDRMCYVDGAHAVVAVPRTVIGGNLQEDIGRWKQRLSSLRQGAAPGFELNVDIVPKVCPSATPHQTTGDCPAVGGMDLEKLFLDESFRLTLKMIGCNSYPILRGAWYDDTFVRSDLKTYENASFRISHFFGREGVLRLIPTALIVVYHPLMECTVSKKAYEMEVRKHLADPCGTLRFCGLVLEKPSAVLENGDTVTLTLEAPDTQQAQLLGVISADKTADPEGVR